MTIWLLTLVAFVLRAGIGLWRPGEFAEGGYTLYIDLARSFLDGHGLCSSPGDSCAIRGPVYPLFLAPFVAAPAWRAVIVAQAAVGAALTPLTFVAGRTLFDRRVATIAAAAAALNPYTVIHDTALQDTVIFNVLAMAAIVLLIEAHARRRAVAWWFAAGVVLGLACLTSFRFLVFVPLALAWAGRVPGSDRARRVLLVALPVIALIGGWVARNWIVVGAPVMTTESGRQLWVANHPTVEEFLPAQSIDAARATFFADLTPSIQGELAATPGEADRDRIFQRMFWDRVRREPLAIGAIAFWKVVYAFSGYLSPARSGVVQLGFALVFAPISILSAIGVWRCRRRSPAHALVALLFLSFIAATAIFWAHTSHVSYLHGLQFVYAAAILSWIRTPPASAGAAYQSPAS